MLKALPTSDFPAKFSGIIPENAIRYFQDLMKDRKLIVRLVSPRRTKLGDFRAGRNGMPSVITVNKNLTSDALVFILAHETAHFLASQHTLFRRRPHGAKWKYKFGNILKDLVSRSCFTDEFSEDILKFSESTRATVSLHSRLHRMLFPDYADNTTLIELDTIPDGCCFRIPGHQKIYVKKEKRRTRIVCMRTDNRKSYLVNHKLRVSIVK